MAEPNSVDEVNGADKADEVDEVDGVDAVDLIADITRRFDDMMRLTEEKFDNVEEELRSLRKDAISLRQSMSEGTYGRNNDSKDCGKTPEVDPEAGRDERQRGSIVADSMVLEEIKDSSEVAQRQEKFEQAYGVRQETIRDEIMTAPKAVQDAYSLLAQMRNPKWREEPEEMQKLARDIEKKCREATRMWEKWLEDGKDGSPPDVESLVRGAERLYEDFCEQITSD